MRWNRNDPAREATGTELAAGARQTTLSLERARASLQAGDTVRHRSVAVGATALGTVAVGSLAVGALAIGALAVGAFAIGRLSVDRASIGRADIGRLRIGLLEIDEIRPAAANDRGWGDVA